MAEKTHVADITDTSGNDLSLYWYEGSEHYSLQVIDGISIQGQDIDVDVCDHFGFITLWTGKTGLSTLIDLPKPQASKLEEKL